MKYATIRCGLCKAEMAPTTSREKHCSPTCRFLDTIPLWDTGCWNWPKSTCVGTGYGQFNTGNKNVTTHSYSYKVFKGELEAGKIVRHTCDNRRCVNPWHLVSGTFSDNTKDMYERGRAGERWNSGEAHHNAKISNEQVAQIRASSEKTKDLALFFNVSESNIRQIRSGKTRISTRKPSGTSSLSAAARR